MKMIDAHRLIDLDEPEQEGPVWIVREQLYPELRGKLPHTFHSEAAARHFYKTGENLEAREEDLQAVS